MFTSSHRHQHHHHQSLFFIFFQIVMFIFFHHIFSIIDLQPRSPSSILKIKHMKHHQSPCIIDHQAPSITNFFQVYMIIVFGVLAVMMMMILNMPKNTMEYI
ncbi:hypothetical protein RND81_02G193500 [Saponaria officinalis]|uniref:Transmembrane protein n=1 Tax=Saponaria officinalis TaxID=3572 RepID=A0AAW1MNT4_SAPOF